MSEEEIIILKVLINNKDVFYYEDDFNNRIRPLVGKLLNLYEDEKEKNRYLKANIPRDKVFYFNEADYVSKKEIRKRMEQTKKVYDEEMKPYMIETGNGGKVLNVSYLSKKEKDELVNKRNCLLVQIRAYEMLLEEE